MVRDLYNPLGQDTIACKAASPQVDDDASCDWPSPSQNPFERRFELLSGISNNPSPSDL